MKLDKWITEINYFLCIVYMLTFLINPERKYIVEFYDWVLLIFIYATTTILIIKDMKKVI